MASNSSKTLPFLVLSIVIVTLFAESYYEIEIDLESLIPVLIPIGIGGVAISSIKKAAEARKSLPKPIEDLIQKEIAKIIEKGRSL